MNLSSLIDHAILHPTQTDDDVRRGCQLADRLGLFSVCVKPYAVPLAAALLRQSQTKVGTVIGFPHGSPPSDIKLAESLWALERGAVELDMVVNIGQVLARQWSDVEREIQVIAEAAHVHAAIVKVIFETDLITQDELKRQLCHVCEQAGADFVKTSTGFGFVKQPHGHYDYVGATIHDVQLMRAACSPRVGVKASGGVRDFAQAMALVEAGANRLGTSASEAIIQGSARDASGY
ncbi:MAG TPA: deoxyribose-phosphate aldolase [Pirellulaceae bacterium]|nr:deoxyribose-phosphate aldolase [Pirellulaceae bacterium]